MTGTGSAPLLDLGSGKGDSLIRAQGRFGVRGRGIELRADRVELARRRGLDVSQGDIVDLDPAEFAGVDYVHVDNVLEHLPDLDHVERAVANAIAIADRLVLIRHPSFEDVEHLADLGVKLHWTDWSGHTAPARIHELVAMANRAGVYRTIVRPGARIVGSEHPSVLPLGAPPDQVRLDPASIAVYDEGRHGPKPIVAFERPVYDQFEILLLTGEGTPELGIGPPGGDRPEIAWADLPGQAPAGWADELEAGRGRTVRVLELDDGRVQVLDGEVTRSVATPLLARALVLMFGSEAMPAAEHERFAAGPPVTALKAPGESAFVVVGGRRHALPRIPATLSVPGEVAARFEVGDPLDVLGAAASLQAERSATRSPGRWRRS